MNDQFLASANFYRAHGLGNDYLVVEAGDEWTVTPESVRALCDRWSGVGSDGVVFLLDREPTQGVFPLRMFNPDGSEFERSGNGLRVLAAYLATEALVGVASPFAVRSGGSLIPMTVHGRDGEGRYDISVEMGVARLGIEAVRGRAEALGESGSAWDSELGPIPLTLVSVGNPHAVVFPEQEPDEVLLHRLGPLLTAHPAFPEGINVQLVRVLGEGRIRILIWERGVGPTHASGTSSCAAAVAAVASGRIPPGAITVEMPGGELAVTVGTGLEVHLRGPVAEVATGVLAPPFLRVLARGG